MSITEMKIYNNNTCMHIYMHVVIYRWIYKLNKVCFQVYMYNISYIDNIYTSHIISYIILYTYYDDYIPSYMKTWVSLSSKQAQLISIFRERRNCGRLCGRCCRQLGVSLEDILINAKVYQIGGKTFLFIGYGQELRIGGEFPEAQRFTYFDERTASVSKRETPRT